MVLELRPAHDPNKTYGFVGVVVSLKDLSVVDLDVVSRRRRKNGKWAVRKVIEIPAEPADPEKLPPLLQGFKAVPPLITDINLSLDDRFLYVSCWGTGEFIQYDVSDPSNPKKTGSVHLGGIVRRAAHPKQARAAAQRRPADGRGQPRRQARLFHQLALLAVGRAVLSRRHQELDGEARRRPEGWHGRWTRSSSSSSMDCARTRCGWKAATPHPTPTAIPEASNDACRISSSTALWLMLLLGAYHGINPGMGWLFAVALGMQERRGSAVARALVPIALGHALAIGGVVLAAVFWAWRCPSTLSVTS